MSCICLCKDTNFKANHNKNIEELAKGMVVYAYAKILILKQITTLCRFLFFLARCICLCKDTNFKANHNIYIRSMFVNALYMPMQRY